jgi:hypothetical protein
MLDTGCQILGKSKNNSFLIQHPTCPAKNTAKAGQAETGIQYLIESVMTIV